MARNGKASGRASGKAKNGKGKAPPRKQRERKPKPTAAQLSDMDFQRLLFDHKKKVIPLIEAKKTAENALKKAYKLAENEGVPKAEIEDALAFDTAEGEERQIKIVKRIMRVGRYCRSKMTEQLEMFPRETVAQRHFEDGRVAALDDRPRKSPAHLTAEKDAQTWLQGYDAGRTALNVERAQGFRPLGDAVKDLAEKAGIAASLNLPAPDAADAQPPAN